MVLVLLVCKKAETLVENKYEILDKLIINDPYFPSLVKPYKKTKISFDSLEISKTKWKTFIPSINWYGINSQYHWWVFGDMFHSKKSQRKGIIRGDFGVSYKDSQPISKKFGTRLSHLHYLCYPFL